MHLATFAVALCLPSFVVGSWYGNGIATESFAFDDISFDMSLLQLSMAEVKTNLVQKGSTMPLCTDALKRRAKYHMDHEITPLGCESHHLANASQPIVEVVQRAREQETSPIVKQHLDGWCYFKEYTSCTAAAQAKDYRISSMTWMISYALSHGAAEDANGYRDKLMTSLPGVYSQDAEVCLQTGWLDLPVAEQAKLLGNFSYAEAHGKDECVAIGDAVNTLTKADKDAMEMAYMIRRAKALMLEPIASNAPIASLPDPFLTPQDAKVYKTYFCAMSGSTACQLHFCLANFCKLPSGEIGAGCQCDPNWNLAPTSS